MNQRFLKIAKDFGPVEKATTLIFRSTSTARSQI
jgi:hypothetical protein